MLLAKPVSLLLEVNAVVIAMSQVRYCFLFFTFILVANTGTGVNYLSLLFLARMQLVYNGSATFLLCFKLVTIYEAKCFNLNLCLLVCLFVSQTETGNQISKKH